MICLAICSLTNISYGVGTKITLMQVNEARQNIIKKERGVIVVTRPQMLIHYPKIGFGDSSSPARCASVGVCGCGCASGCSSVGVCGCGCASGCSSVGVSPRTTT